MKGIVKILNLNIIVFTISKAVLRSILAMRTGLPASSALLKIYWIISPALDHPFLGGVHS